MERNSKSTINKPHPVGGWYGAAEAARLSNLSLAMVNHLSRHEIVSPSCDCKRGHGIRRHYSFGDVVALRLVSKLSAAGVSVLRLKKALKGLRRLHPQITLTSLPASHVVTDGKDIYLRCGGDPLERVFDGQLTFAFVIELAQIQAELARKVSPKAGMKGTRQRRAAS